MNKTHFNKRVSKGRRIEEALIKLLEEWGIEHARTGYEYWLKTDNYVKCIGKLNDNTSKLVRHFPDVSTVSMNKKTSILIEVKGSSGIERECYDHLINMESAGHHVYLCFGFNSDKNNFELKVVRPSLLKFGNPWRHANKVKREAGLTIPIDRQWLNPRLLNEELYYKYLAHMKNRTSGCSFAFIDFKKTPFNPIEDLLKWMIA